MRSASATVGARTVENDVVIGDVELQIARQARDRLLQTTILERDDASAAVAHEVVVMLAAGMRGLVPRSPLTDLDTRDEVELVELLERAVDAGDPHAAAL